MYCTYVAVNMNVSFRLFSFHAFPYCKQYSKQSTKKRFPHVFEMLTCTESVCKLTRSVCNFL